MHAMNVRMRLPAPLAHEAKAPVAGIDLRPATAADADALAVLLTAAFPGWDWPVDQVRERLLDTPDVVCTWLATIDGTIVGTASEQLVAEAGDTVGSVHWVAVAEGQRGRGLGRVLTAAVVDGLWARGVSSIRLDTQVDRPNAIALYAGFGFVPEIRSSGELAAWSAVMATIVRSR
jgi:ribosomal protein S18 acetylase RimI-like enzyme